MTEVTCRIRMKVPKEYQGETGVLADEYALFIQKLLASVNGKMLDLRVMKDERLGEEAR